MQIITVVSVQIIFLFSHKSLIKNWVSLLRMDMNWPLGGQGSLSSVIHFAFLFFSFHFLFKMLKPSSGLPSDLIWRTVLCAFHVETEECRSRWCFDFVYFGEISFFSLSSCKIQEMRKRNHPPPASKNLWTPSSIPVLSPSQTSSQQLICSLPVLYGGESFAIQMDHSFPVLKKCTQHVII